MVMTSTQLSPRTISEQLNEDNKKRDFQRYVHDQFSVNATEQGLVVMTGYIGYITRSNLVT